MYYYLLEFIHINVQTIIVTRLLRLEKLLGKSAAYKSEACISSVTCSRAKPQKTPSVEKHAHPPRVVYCAIYSTLTRFTKFRV